ncbi:MAG TPA: SET domain-containing protein [Patescibacteria group bacterium]|nr:SET domain-containing protein [Patescibacteria group bacterium]
MQYDVEVRNTTKKKGRGVYALRDFKKGELVESCPVLTFTPTDRKNLEKTPMSHYIYPWRSTRGASLSLGYGSIYNHSFSPNADWKQNFKTQEMEYKAIKPIKKGEEILINYNGEPDDMTLIDWFDVE